MKRKTTNEKPVWQDEEMGKLVSLMDGWEVLKSGLKKLEERPGGIAAVKRWHDEKHPEAQFHREWLESIVPAARAEISAWLISGTATAEVSEREAVPPCALHSPITVFLAIARLWERFLAVSELGISEDRARWLSEKTREEQLLLIRLSKRVKLQTP